MRQKRVRDAAEAVADVFDGATVLIGGFGRAGVAEQLVDALVEKGVKDLTVVNNNSGYGETGVAKLARARALRKLICTFPWAKDAYAFREAWEEGGVEVEIVPQGTLAERMRAAGAGIGGFLTRTGVGTELAQGKQVMEIEGVKYLLELPLRGDFAFVRAHQVDLVGNLTYRKAMRNFNPIMAMAAKVAIVEANEELPIGGIDPEVVITPGIYVNRYFIREAR